MKAKTASRASPVAGVLLESKSQTQVGFEVGLVTSRSKQGQSRDGLPRGSGNWGPSLYSKDVCLIDTWHVKEVALDRRPSQTPLCFASRNSHFADESGSRNTKTCYQRASHLGAHCVAKVSPQGSCCRDAVVDVDPPGISCGSGRPWKGSSALSMG